MLLTAYADEKFWNICGNSPQNAEIQNYTSAFYHKLLSPTKYEFISVLREWKKKNLVWTREFQISSISENLEKTKLCSAPFPVRWTPEHNVKFKKQQQEDNPF